MDVRQWLDQINSSGQSPFGGMNQAFADNWTWNAERVQQQLGAGQLGVPLTEAEQARFIDWTTPDQSMIDSWVNDPTVSQEWKDYVAAGAEVLPGGYVRTAAVDPKWGGRWVGTNTDSIARDGGVALPKLFIPTYDPETGTMNDRATSANDPQRRELLGLDGRRYSETDYQTQWMPAVESNPLWQPPTDANTDIDGAWDFIKTGVGSAWDFVFEAPTRGSHLLTGAAIRDQADGDTSIWTDIWTSMPMYNSANINPFNWAPGLRDDTDSRTRFATNPEFRQDMENAHDFGVQYQTDENGKPVLVVLDGTTKAQTNTPVYIGNDAVYKLYEWHADRRMGESLLQMFFDDPLFLATIGSGLGRSVFSGAARSASLAGDAQKAAKLARRAEVIGRLAAGDDELFRVMAWLPTRAAKLAGKGVVKIPVIGPPIKKAATAAAQFSDRTLRRDAAENAGEIRNAATDFGDPPGMADGTPDVPRDPTLPDPDLPVPPQDMPNHTDPRNVPDPLPADPNPGVDGIPTAPSPTPPPPSSAQASDLLTRVGNGIDTRPRYDGQGLVKESPGYNWMRRLATDNPEAWSRVAARLEEPLAALIDVLKNAERTGARKVDRVFAMHRFMVAFRQSMLAEGLNPLLYKGPDTSGFFDFLLDSIGRKGDNFADTYSREGLTEVLLHSDRPADAQLLRRSRWQQAFNWMWMRGDLQTRPFAGIIEAGRTILPDAAAKAAARAQLIQDILTGKVTSRVGGRIEQGLVIGGGGRKTNRAWQDLLAPFDQGTKTFLVSLSDEIYRRALHLGERVPAPVGVRFTNEALLEIQQATLRTVSGEIIPAQQFLTGLADLVIRQQDEAYDYWRRIQLARGLDEEVTREAAEAGLIPPASAAPEPPPASTAPEPPPASAAPEPPTASAAPEPPPASTAPEPPSPPSNAAPPPEPPRPYTATGNLAADRAARRNRLRDALDLVVGMRAAIVDMFDNGILQNQITQTLRPRLFSEPALIDAFRELLGGTVTFIDGTTLSADEVLALARQTNDLIVAGQLDQITNVGRNAWATVDQVHRQLIEVAFEDARLGVRGSAAPSPTAAPTPNASVPTPNPTPPIGTPLSAATPPPAATPPGRQTGRITRSGPNPKLLGSSKPSYNAGTRGVYMSSIDWYDPVDHALYVISTDEFKAAWPFLRGTPAQNWQVGRTIVRADGSAVRIIKGKKEVTVEVKSAWKTAVAILEANNVPKAQWPAAAKLVRDTIYTRNKQRLAQIIKAYEDAGRPVPGAFREGYDAAIPPIYANMPNAAAAPTPSAAPPSGGIPDPAAAPPAAPSSPPPPPSSSIPDPSAGGGAGGATPPPPPGGTPPPPSGGTPPPPSGGTPPPPDPSVPPAPRPEPNPDPDVLADPATDNLPPRWQPRDLDALVEIGDLAPEQRALLETRVDTSVLRDAFKNRAVTIDGVIVKIGKVLDEVDEAGTSRTAIDLFDHLNYLIKDPTMAEELLAEALFAANAGTARYSRYLARRDSKSIARRALRAYDKALSFLRRKMQFNVATGPAAMNQDAFSNTLMITQAGRLGAMQRVAVLWPKGMKKAITDMADVSDFAEATIHEAVGLRPPNYVHHGFDRAQSGELLGTREYASQNKFWKAGTGIFESETIKKMRSYNDSIFRMALEEDYLIEYLGFARDDLLAEFQEVAARRGLDGVALGKQLDERLGRFFTPDDVKAAVDNLLDEGQGTHFKKRWRSETYSAAKRARTSQEKLLFNYRTTNADELLSRVLFFHYWQSRALMTYTKLALSSYPLMSFYMQAWDRVKLESMKEGYPPEFRSYVRFMADHDGLVGYIDPIAVATVYQVYEYLAEENGNAPAWKRAVGSVFFVNPLIQAALAVAGLDTIGGIEVAGSFTPNIFGARSVTNAATIAINHINANTGFRLSDGVIPNIEERLVRATVEAANGKLRNLIPAVSDSNLYDPQQGDFTKIRSIMLADYEAKYGASSTWTPEVWTKWGVSDESLLHGGDDDMARAAIETYWDQRLKLQAVRTVVPGVRVRSMPYDQAKMDKKAGNPAVRDAGWGRVNLITQTGEATQLNATLDQYQAIGTDEQRRLADGYTAIQTGDLSDLGRITINGIPYSGPTLRKMAAEDRAALAWLWVQEQGGEQTLRAYWSERDAFKVNQPVMEQYDAYWASKRAFKDDAAWRAGLAARNPAFAQALRDYEAYLDDQNFTGAYRETRLQGWMARDGYLAWLGDNDQLGDAPLPPPGGQGLPVPPEDDFSKPPSEDETPFTAQLDRLGYAYNNYKDQIKNAEQRLEIMGIPAPDFWTLYDPQMTAYYRQVLGVDYPTPMPLLQNYWWWADRERRAGRGYSFEAYAAFLTRDDPSSPAYAA